MSVQKGICGKKLCPYLCIRAEHCRVGLMRRSQLLAMYREKRERRKIISDIDNQIMETQVALEETLKLQGILNPVREFKSVGELTDRLEELKRERDREMIQNWQGLCESGQAGAGED